MKSIGIGSKVGRLTVEEPTSQRKSGYTVWRCRCECGGKVLLDTRRLQRETVKDCGCALAAPPGEGDITGLRFGRLTALCPAGERSGRGNAIWNCQCDCGKAVQVRAGQLTMGYRKSCGCLRHPPLKDFVGRRFGKLTVVEYAGKRSGMHRWRCVCSCGNETVAGQTLLQNGKTRSCGCLQGVTYRDNLQLVEDTSVTILKAIKSGRLIKSNTSGHNGVYYNKKKNLWVAQITFQKKTRYLGSYSCLEDAVEARRRGEKIYDDFLEKLESAGGLPPGFQEGGGSQAEPT